MCYIVYILCILQCKSYILHYILSIHLCLHSSITNSYLLCFIAELKQLQEGTADVTMETKKELSRLHQYTLQLEKQVRGSLRKEDQHSEPSISASEVARLNSEIERLHHRCQQLQNDLNQVRSTAVHIYILYLLIYYSIMKAQQTLSLEREEHRVKLCSLENSLTLSRKANQDYEV